MRQLQTLFGLGSVGNLTDGQLLELFTGSSAEAAELAFAEVVGRHGPMVMRVCRHSLQNPSDAQDAFQATFLVLVQKAKFLWVRESLGPWLHRVACRVASKARTAEARRRSCENSSAGSRPTICLPMEEWRDVFLILHEEIDRLPERCRVAVILCDVEGLTHEQASRRLRWPVGTVKSRLNRGREYLRDRLIRRGITPSIGLLALLTTAQSTPAAIPSILVGLTVRTARSVAVGKSTAGMVPAKVALLVQGALNTMFLTKIRLVMLVSGFLATGAVGVAHQSGPMKEGELPLVRSRVTKSPGSPARDGDGIDKAVKRAMDQLDAELLREELQVIRNQTQDAFRKKTHEERTEPEKSRIEGDPRVSLKQAEYEYQAVRAAYQTKLRELATLVNRLNSDHPGSGNTGDVSPGTKTPNKQSDGDQETTKPPAYSHGAVIGSIDIDAVFKGYQKTQEATKRLQSEVNLRREELTNLERETRQEMQKLQNVASGSGEYKKKESRITELKTNMEAAREQAQREFTTREAQIMGAIFEDIQDTISSVAKAKGLNYVVKASPKLRLDPDTNEVTTALGRSVLYADPRNDVTEEVLRELNQKYRTSGAKTPKSTKN